MTAHEAADQPGQTHSNSLRLRPKKKRARAR
jgi:hypothetical protein